MKTKLLSVLAGTIGFLSSSALAATSAEIDLSGVTLQNGLAVSGSSSAALDAAYSYQYAIVGTCHATGLLAGAIPPGTSIGSALDAIKPGNSALLNGTVFNPSGALAFPTLSNLPLGGNRRFGPVKLSVSAKVKLGLDATGLALFDLTGVKIKRNNNPSPQDTLVFEAGTKCTITIPPAPSASIQPDLIIVTPPNAGYGNDIYSALPGDPPQRRTYKIRRGKTNTVLLLIQNDGPTQQDFGFKGVAGHFVKNKYFDGGTEITAVAVDADPQNPGPGFVFTLPSGSARLLTMKVTVPASLHPGSSEDDEVLVYAVSNVNRQDRIHVKTIAK